jgi:hypothetical protein
MRASREAVFGRQGNSVTPALADSKALAVPVQSTYRFGGDLPRRAGDHSLPAICRRPVSLLASKHSG